MNNTPEINLRPALVDDAALLVALMRAAFAEYHGRLDPPSGVEAESEQGIRERFGDTNAVIASLEGEDAGCVFYEKGEDYLYLGRLSVLPAFRRRGVAQALIRHVEEQARQLNLARVKLGTRLALPELISFYQRLGYRITAEHAHPGYDHPTYATLEKEV